MLGGNGAESSGTVNTNLEHVDLSNCCIGPVGAQNLAQALCVNASVKTLELRLNPVICDKGAKALAEMLGGNGAESSGTVNTTLEYVDLRKCYIGPVGARHLAQALCANTSVKKLKLFEQNNYQLNWRDIRKDFLTKQQKKVLNIDACSWKFVNSCILVSLSYCITLLLVCIIGRAKRAPHG